MKYVCAAFICCAFMGLGGLGVASWLLATGQSTASVDNLFLTLVALCLTVAGLGYDVWLIRLIVAQAERRRSRARTPATHTAADTGARNGISAKAA